MLDNLTNRLARVMKTLKGEARLTESNIADALREVRMALLEADVALPVIKAFIASVKEKAVGEEVIGSLSPGQALVGVVHRELARIMGDAHEGISFNTQPPAIVLMAGLQGAGKTTTVGKLGKFLKENHKKKVLVVSCDVYRPAAIEQLKSVAGQAGVDFFPSTVGEKPEAIALAAVDWAKRHYHDVLLVDTAGRLAVDEEMMAEIKRLHAALNPIETLFVVDAMLGQDAVNTAKAFNEALPLTGVVLTKLDGDARGGAALSVRHITGKPIKFAGVGEKLGGWWLAWRRNWRAGGRGSSASACSPWVRVSPSRCFCRPSSGSARRQAECAAWPRRGLGTCAIRGCWPHAALGSACCSPTWQPTPS